MHRTKAVSWMLLLTFVLSILVVGIPVTIAANPPEGTYALFDVTDNDHNVTWVVGSEPGTYPQFDVELRVTNVTSGYASSFSLEYDPTVLNYSSHSWPAPGTGAWDAGGKVTVPLDPTIDYTNGYIIGGSVGHLSPDGGSVKTYTDPNWGVVVTFTFDFIGAVPSLGSPINTLINITNRLGPPVMESLWWKFGSPSPFTGPFQIYTPCGFFYEAQMGIVAPPTADFTYTGGIIYEGQTVTFDGSPPNSVGGQDGDGPCPITEWWWDFGDGNSSFMTPTGIVTHVYPTAGSYPVCLYVIAPGVPPYIDPTYVNKSATTCHTVSIVVMAFTGIDVYTEDFRWPWYYTDDNGTGPYQNASCFRPQENIDLYAYVYYNDDAVQNKLVKFHIRGPETTDPLDQFVFTRTAYSSNGTVWNGTGWMPMPEGVAWIAFRVPWPCENAHERVFGVWCVTVEVSLPDVKPGEEIIYEDRVCFKVSWGVDIIELRTLNATGSEVSQFKKCEEITVEVTLQSCHMMPVNAVIAITVYDDVGTIVGSCHAIVEVPAEYPWCNPGTVVTNCTIHIPKWAYVGPHAMVYANAYTTWPWSTMPLSEPWCPEASQPIIIVKA